MEEVGNRTEKGRPTHLADGVEADQLVFVVRCAHVVHHLPAGHKRPLVLHKIVRAKSAVRLLQH